MSEETFDLILGILLIGFGTLLLIYKIMNPLKKDENEFGKAAHYQIIGLAIVLVMIGIFLI
jgi:hypothetical protein